MLVVEDEFLVAADLEDALTGLGAEVLGPFGSITEAASFLEAETPDAAVLDVNVKGEMIFPVADLLKKRGVPFVFCTGYADISLIPDRFEQVTTLGKPFSLNALTKALQARVRAA